MTESQAPNQTTVQAQNLPVMIHAQYVKDISFENPHAPFTLRAGQEQPKMDVNVTLDAHTLEDPQIKNLYEVVMKLTVRSDRKDQVLFMAELTYGIAVSLPEVPQEQHHPLLLIEVPKMAFPFARKILADLTQDGGYPPLLLGPIDFYSMYVARFASKQNGADKKAATH